MNIFTLIKYITQHPLNKNRKWKSIIELIKWQINCKLNNHKVLIPFGEKSTLICWKGLTGATGNLYCGLHEFSDMAFLLHFLRNTDDFIDIGANIGSYTVLAASEIGTHTIAFEPVPTTFKNLQNNVKINNIESITTLHNCGLGNENGTIKFTSKFDTVNHVATSDSKDTIEVEIKQFDKMVSINKNTLIKIDVEGYETEVLMGMNEALANDKTKAIIIELNGSGARYGYDENDIHKSLIAKGFLPFIYHPFTRELEKIDSFGSHNTIYIRDLNFVSERIEKSKKFNIHSSTF